MNVDRQLVNDSYAAVSACRRQTFANTRVSWRARMLNRTLRNVVKKRLSKVDCIARLRTLAYLADSYLSRPINGSKVSDEELNGVPLRWYWQKEANGKVVLYLHGGGFCVHMPRVYDGFADLLSKKLNADVFLPNYRLAPEHPFPAAAEDCFAVYKGLLEKGFNPDQISLVGDSAGGCLVLTTLLQIRDHGLPMPACAVSMSPVTELPENDPELRQKAELDPLFPANLLLNFSHNYLANKQDSLSPLAFPLLGDLYGLPPLQLHAGSTEALLDHSVKFADKAAASGVAVSLNIWQEMPHIHPLFHLLPESDQAVQMIVDFVDEHLTTE